LKPKPKQNPLMAQESIFGMAFAKKEGKLTIVWVYISLT
jgi:hypothetical protein